MVYSMGVSGAGANVPASTQVDEKTEVAVKQTNGFEGAAIIIKFEAMHYAQVGTLVSLDKMHFNLDEEFYRTGYKATLNETVKEIAVPPDIEEEWSKCRASFC